MTIWEELFNSVEKELRRVAKYIKAHPEKGKFFFLVLKDRLEFNIFTDIEPEVLEPLVRGTLYYTVCNGGSRSCTFRFYYGQTGIYFEANVIKIDYYWPLPE